MAGSLLGDMDGQAQGAYRDYDAGAVSIYADTLKSIQTATETALSRPLEVRAITCPAHFFEGEPIFNLRLAASSPRLRYFPDDDDDDDDDAYDQIVALYNAARLAHHLDNCKMFGGQEGCDIFSEDNFALHLKNPASEYFQQVASAIQGFMDEMIVKMTEYYGIKDSKLKVRGVILAGEASREGMEGFKEIIEASLPEYKGRFMFDVDPSLIGAKGAAHRARQWALKMAFVKPRGPFHDDL
ncbi:uncharacterized protein LY89DRAFT_731207 [Mollisia scopiformis]|uniref:Uncharacterized protein n=1 Tax=Mollisia scopiformis TaxID=149040 RepID=A0A194XIB5_MOLSC|nr:uncharacterized protein LY89DRAFT_731207 [Mollisia scopiformis]KUJ19965.1 hypothetical protein LY89DRAFT_731207 [Mollisia scopiformis]